MPVYGYICLCGANADMVRRVNERDMLPRCVNCNREMQRELSAPLFRFAGRIVEGGGPDRFTADVLGIPLKELPEGLKTKV